VNQSRIIFGVGAMMLAYAQPAVWITDGLAKVQPNATPGSASSLNIYAARNEFESFQVHVQAGSTPISLSVSVTDFVGNGGSRISANPNIAVFREGYITVTTPSDLNGITGQVPDPLIPVQDAYFHQPRNAFPVTVPTGQTRSAWVDVYVPSTAEAGYYTASANVMDGANLIATVALNLKVWNFTLPSTSTLKTAFAMGYGSLGFAAYPSLDAVGAYPGAGGNPFLGLDLIHAAVATFFLDHRVSLAPVIDPTIPAGNWSEFDSVYGPLISGTEPTILPGARLSALQYPNTLRPADTADLLDWVGHFSWLTAPQQLYGALCDEPPSGCSWSDLYKYGTAAHAAAPNFPVLVTTSIALATQNNVLDAIDILTPVLDYIQPMNAPSTRSAYNAWLQLPGKQLWWYQSCDQHETCVNGTPGPLTSTWPVYTIDASPVRNRIFQWLAYLYGIQGELYYYVEGWGPNPWSVEYSTGGNGDGVLYYPGTIDVIGGAVPVPVASMRLKLIRDGMEDFEYLNLLSQAGQSSFAATISSTFIQNAYTFNNDPSALTSARMAIGELLNGLAVTPTILTFPANGGTGVSLTPTFSWLASSGATSYDVYFGTSPTPPMVTNVTTTSYSPATLSAGTTYYWQIVAKNTISTGASPVWSFTTVLPGAPSTPVLTFPANGSTGVALAPRLTWNASSGATSYSIYFGTSTAPAFVTTTTATSYSPGFLIPANTYYWQIVASNGTGPSSSAIWGFTTLIHSAAPIPILDFNGDGDQDVFLYDPAGGTGYAGLSNGSGAFTYVYNGFTPGFDAIRYGNFNSSGLSGLVAYNSSSTLGYTLLGTGAGTFTPVSLFWGPGFTKVAAGDLNGDGLTDFVIYRPTDGTSYTAISNGDGTFHYQYTLVSIGFTHMVVADFNGDGKADVFLYRSSDGLAFLGISNGTGGFTFSPVTVGPGYGFVESGDINGDGMADLLFYSSSSGATAVGLSTGTGFNLTSYSYSPGFTTVKLFDFNGDGKADVALYNMNNTLGYLGVGNGTGGFTFSSLFWGAGMTNVDALDLNNDGKIDIVIYNSANGASYTGISTGNASSPFTYQYSYWGVGKVLAATAAQP
jgi:hypothetical protein